MGAAAGCTSFVSRIDSSAVAYAVTRLALRPYRPIAGSQRPRHHGVGRSTLAWNSHQQKLSLAAAPFASGRFRTRSHGQDETGQRVPRRESGGLCHWGAPVRTSSGGRAVGLLPPRTQSSSGILLGPASFASTAWSVYISRAGCGGRLLSLIPCRLGHSVRRCLVGISPHTHPNRVALGDDYRLHADNGLALLQRCARGRCRGRHLDGDRQSLFRINRSKSISHESLSLDIGLPLTNKSSEAKLPTEDLEPDTGGCTRSPRGSRRPRCYPKKGVAGTQRPFRRRRPLDRPL